MLGLYAEGMFGMFKKRAAEPAPHMAAEITNTPLSNEMTLMIAQELPLLDSADRVRVYEILDNYSGPQITTQEELPQEIRDMMDL